jgi:hypothetical protein
MAIKKASTSGRSARVEPEAVSRTVRRKNAGAAPRPEREETSPLMLRPKSSQKECAEQIAEQIGIKRSQLDASFYLTGALLTGVERLGKEEQIGTWTRKQAAIYLKNTFTPLFELLYEQNELPLVFSLLIARGGAPVSPAVPVPPGEAPVPASQPRQESPTSAYLPLLSADAEIGLDGFPGGI